MAEPGRIHKVLADAGVASRRAAEAMVAAGRVTVNGRVAAVGERVDPATDRIAVDGRPLRAAPEHRYLALNKPAGVTSTVADRHAATTVIDLVPTALRAGAPRLYPVGRLDRDSEGLLLLTNDGDWAQRVLHPRYEVEREYAVAVAVPLDARQADALRAGIPLEEGLATLRALRPATPVEASRMGPVAGRRAVTWYRAVLTQGWKRQVRRMFAAVGAPVDRLVRVRIGTLRLDDLPTGGVRALSAAERDRLVSTRPVGTASRTGGPVPGTPSRSGPPPVRRIVVSLDGPASSGKSSVGAAAAAAVGYRFCDTGILYRALARIALDAGVPLDDGRRLRTLTGRIRLAPDDAGRLARALDGDRDLTATLHTPEVDRAVSAVAADPGVRAALLPLQRAIARDGGIVMAGRDIGSVVIPDAPLRLWLDVSLEERAVRRARQRSIDPASPDGDRIRADLARRDGLDSTRMTAPLRIPDGATIIAAGELDFDHTVAAVVGAIRKAERAAGAAS